MSFELSYIRILYFTLLYWVVSGWVQIFPLVVGWVGCVSQLMGWVGSGHTKWTHGQLWKADYERHGVGVRTSGTSVRGSNSSTDCQTICCWSSCRRSKFFNDIIFFSRLSAQCRVKIRSHRMRCRAAKRVMLRYWHCPHSMRSRIYVTVRCPSVRPSVCPFRPLQQRAGSATFTSDVGS